MLLRGVGNRCLLGLAEDLDHLLVGERALAHVASSSSSKRVNFLASAGPVFARQVRRVLAKLRAAIETLDPESKAFVQLYFDDGLTVDEVAKRLKVVRRTVFRIQERVNAQLIAAIDKM